MRYLWLIVLLVATSAVAEELPEPTLEIDYAFQIHYGMKNTDGTFNWQALTPTTWVEVDMPPTASDMPDSIPTGVDHDHWSSDAVFHFYGEAATSTEEQQRMLAMEFEMTDLPRFYFMIFRVRCIGYRAGGAVPPNNHENWSDASKWVGIIKIGKMFQVFHMNVE